MQKLLGIIKRFTTGLGPVEQAQIVASTAVVVSMVTIVSAIAATGQVPRLMDFISVLTIGLFGFTSVMFSLRYGRQLDAQRRQLLALNTTAEAVNAIVDRAGFLETTLVHLHAALGTTSGWVYTLNNGSLELVAGAMSRQDDIIPLLGVAAADVLAWSRVPHILQNSSQVETEALPSAVRSTGIHFLCTVPLRVRDTLVGTIVLAGEKDTTLPVQPELLEAFSKQLSAGLNNVRLVEELRESRTRYADLFEHSPDAYFIIRENGTILDCNATACSLIGTKKESLLGHSFDALFSSDRQEELRQRIRDMWDGEADLRDVEETMLSPEPARLRSARFSAACPEATATAAEPP